MILKDTDGLIKRRLKVIALAPLFLACLPVGAAVALFRPIIEGIRAVANDLRVGWRVVCQILRELWQEAAELEKYGPKEAAVQAATATAAASRTAAFKTKTALRKAWLSLFIDENDSRLVARLKLAYLLLPAATVASIQAVCRGAVLLAKDVKVVWNHQPRVRKISK